MISNYSKRLLYLIIAFSLFPYIAFSQVVIKGKVLDPFNKPIRSAHIQLIDKNQNIGTITNENGEYRLYLKESNSINFPIIVSCIGYKPMYFIQKEEIQNIIMKEDIIRLNEVEITPRDYAREIVKEAIKNIPENYPNKEERLRGFVRELLHWKYMEIDSALYVVESVVESIKNSYEFPNQKGVVKLIKSRKYESSGLDTLKVRIYAGSHHPHRFDAVSKRTEFLNLPEKYVYDLADTLRFGNKNLFKIYFNREKHVDGFIYIIDSSFAITKAEFFYENFSPLSLKDKSRKYLKYTVNYNQSADGLWRISNTYYETEFTRQKNDLTLISEYITTNHEINNLSISYPEQIQFSDIMLDKSSRYDSLYWKNYNVILSDSVTENLFKKQEFSGHSNPYGQRRVFNHLRKIRTSLAIDCYSPSISPFQIAYSNRELVIDKSNGSETKYTLSLSSSMQYEWRTAFFIGVNTIMNLTDPSVEGIDLQMLREFNLNPKGRPILLSPSISIGYQQLSKLLGNFKSESSYRVNGKTFDSGSADILLQQRGLRLLPSVSLGIEKSHRLQYFVTAGYNLQINQQVGLYFDETDQFFLKQKSTFLKNGHDGLAIDFRSSVFDNSWSLSMGIYLSF